MLTLNNEKYSLMQVQSEKKHLLLFLYDSELISSDLRFELPTTDYLWSSFMANNLFCLHITLGPISEVRTCKQTIYSY
jgi:hypothetical protein